MRERIRCRHCGRTRSAEAKGLCSTCYKRHGHLYPSAVHQWTGKEVAYIREHYGHLAPSVIARVLGLPRGLVTARARALGLVHWRFVWDGHKDTALRHLVARGRSDQYAAGVLGCHEGTVLRRRRKLGLTKTR